MPKQPVKNPKLPITTAYFKRDGSTFRTYSSNAVRALMLATGHMTMDHYTADTVHIYDSHNADLYFELARAPGGVEILDKCDLSKLDDPLRKRRKSVDYLMAGI
jgi:predicted HTH transcriptional regulator